MYIIVHLIQLGLDAGTLALCCESVFRKWTEAKVRDFLLFPMLFLICIVPKINFTAGESMTVDLPVKGFEIMPASSMAGLLFLIFAVLLLNSSFLTENQTAIFFAEQWRSFPFTCV